MKHSINNIINHTESFDGMTLVEKMEHCHTPSISVATIKDYTIDTVFTLGVKEWGKNDKVEPSHLYQAASISKPVFACAVMKLNEQGIINIDEDINKYLIKYKIVNSDYELCPVTLRGILTHSAGITVDGFEGYLRTEEIPTLDDILEGKGNSDKIIVNTNTIGQYNYSGGGFVIAQKVIQDVTGKCLPEVIDELVLKPLDMKNSTYKQPLPDEKLNDCVTGHYSNYEKVPGNFRVYPEIAAAGLWTTPTDLAKFGLAIQKGLLSDGPWLKKETLYEMVTEQNVISNKIGISFELGNNYFHHDGCNEGFISNMVLSKKGGNGAIIMVNAYEGGGLAYETFFAVATINGWPIEF